MKILAHLQIKDVISADLIFSCRLSLLNDLQFTHFTKDIVIKKV
jgi:hypothetical protein